MLFLEDFLGAKCRAVRTLPAASRHHAVSRRGERQRQWPLLSLDPPPRRRSERTKIREEVSALTHSLTFLPSVPQQQSDWPMPPPSDFLIFFERIKILILPIFPKNLDFDKFLASRGAEIELSASKSLLKVA